MKTILYKANERGHANHGWLDSWHSFSFAGYYDPAKMNFGALRVLNDDSVKAGFGFGKHPHDNMEIVSIPLSGALKHSDSTGREAIIQQNDVQIMSAGSGIAHSEMNASTKEEVKFLQIWIMPKEKNITPRYEQKVFMPEERKNKIQTVVAPDIKEAIWINQDAWLSLADLDRNFETIYEVKKKDNGLYAFVLNGEVSINEQPLQKRDALGMYETGKISITANSDAALLLIEIPMAV
jgi:redox-sensitive bicupin YhaK (pirin superfamily)